MPPAPDPPRPGVHYDLAAGTIGKANPNIAPPVSAEFRAYMVPLWSCMIFLQMDRPNPVPLDLPYVANA